MPEEPTVSLHVLKYSTDAASVQQSVGAVDTLKASFKDVGASVDRATSGLAAAGARVLSLRQEVKGLAEEQRRLEQAWLAGESATDAFVDATVKLERKRQDLAQAERGLRDEIAGTSDEMRQQRAEADRLLQQRADWQKASLYGDVESSARNITGAVGFLGGEAGARVERTLNVGTELLATAEGMGRLKQQLPTMAKNLDTSTLALGALGVGVVGASVAFEAMSQVIDRSTASVKNYLSYEEEYWRLRTHGTTEDAQAFLDEKKARLESLQARQAELQFILDEADKTGGALGTIYDGLQIWNEATDILGKGNIDAGGMESLKDQLKEVNEEVASLGGETNRLESDLQAGAFAANDAAAAEKELADQRKAAQEQFAASVDEQFRYQVEMGKARRDWSQEQLDQTLSDIEIEKNARQRQLDDLRAFAASGFVDPSAIAAVEQAIQDLETEASYIENFIAPVVAAREAEIETIENAKVALEKLTDYREDELAAAQEATEDAQEAFDKRAELQKDFKDESVALEAERAREILDEEVDFARQRLRDMRDFNLELADLDQEYLDKRGDLVDAISEAQTEANAAQVDAIKDHQKEDVKLLKEHKQRLRDIERDAERSVEDSAATLNAAAVVAAKERGAEALNEERTRYAEARVERDADFQDLLGQLHLEGQAKVDAARQAVVELDHQHEQERSARQQAFARQLADEDEDRRVSQQRQREAWKREDDERRDHLNEQLRELKTQQRDALVAARQHYGNLRTATIDGMARVQDAFTRGMGTLVASVTRTLTGSTPPAKGYAPGGTPPLGEDVWVGEKGTEWATIGQSAMLLGQRGPERVRFADAATVYRHGQAPTIQLAMPLTVQAGAGGIDTGALQGFLERRLGPMVQRELLGFFGGRS